MLQTKGDDYRELLSCSCVLYTGCIYGDYFLLSRCYILFMQLNRKTVNLYLLLAMDSVMTMNLLNNITEIRPSSDEYILYYMIWFNFPLEYLFFQNIILNRPIDQWDTFNFNDQFWIQFKHFILLFVSVV